jgi:ABC-type cobalamin/Fe3+-siderophores transport system ATPase subunit
MDNVKCLLSTNALLSDTLCFKNSLIIGDNASAKTFVLEKAIESNLSLSPYYISVNNRDINIDKVRASDQHFFDDYKVINSKLLKKRLESNEDLWADNSIGSNIFAQILNYSNFFSVIEEFFEEKIIIHMGKNVLESNIIYIGEVPHKKLSNGLSSIFRVILELEAAKALRCNIVFIDEIEKYLDFRNSYKLIQFIQSKYPEFTFIITTHSDDVIVGSSDFNIIKINNDSCVVADKSIEIYDSNDYDSSMATKRKFFQIDDNEKFAEVFVNINRIYDNLLVNDKVCQNDITYLSGLQSESLPQKITNIIDEINSLSTPDET